MNSIAHKLTNDLNLVVEHFLGQAGVGAEEDGRIHDGISSGECGGNAGVVDFREGCAVGTNQADGLGAIFPHLHKDRLPEKITAEEHAVADLFFIQVVGQGAMAEGSGGPNANHESEPRAVGAAASGVPGEVGNLRLETRGLNGICLIHISGFQFPTLLAGGRLPSRSVGGKAEFEDIFQVCKARAEDFPVPFAGFDEGGKFFELLTANGSLGIERLEVVTEVTIDVFVIVALWQLAELPTEAFAAGVVFA